MELKVVCYCGQKYKFDVEPVDGRMPFTVNCPVCNVDGTPLANQLLREQISGIRPPAPIAAAPLVAPLPTPAPIAPAPMAAAPAIVPPSHRTTGPTPQREPAPAATGSGVRVKMSASAPPPLPAAAAPPTLPATAPASAAAPKPITPLKPAAAPKVQSKKFNLGLGILGAFLGAAIGGAVVYGFFALLNIRFPLTGVAVGALAGYGARLLARGTDTTLGIIAGGLALIATAGAFYLIYLEYDRIYITGIVSVVIGTGVAYRLASE
jgi:hypothetical protein